MAKRLVRLAGAAVSLFVAASAEGQRTPQLIENPIGVTPVRFAPAVYAAHGPERVGDWMAYEGGDDWGDPVFDCYGDDDRDGVPDDAGACGLGSGRWYFGSGYCNLFVTNDMTIDRHANLGLELFGLDLAWYWTASGSWSSERCVIGVFTQESAPCEPDSLDYGGWLFDYGTLAGSPDGYYYSNIDLSGIATWPAPSLGVGSYVLAFLQAETSSGAWVFATCAQPMLWGTGDARGDPGAPGTQGPGQFDDGWEPDGVHEDGECQSYAFGVCPDPLGAMVRFWGTYCCPPCQMVNCNGDSGIDTQDFLCYLNLWVVKDPDADLDGNGVVDVRDFLRFLDVWSQCWWRGPGRGGVADASRAWGSGAAGLGLRAGWAGEEGLP